MIRIGSGVPATGVRKFRNRYSRIQAKQNEINRLKELMKEGLIDAEEAIRRINILEAQIQELEFGVPDGGESDVEIEYPQNQPNVVVGAPVNASAGQAITQDPMILSPTEPPDGADLGGDDDDDDDDKFEDKEYGKDDAYSYNAHMLKIYHGLT